MDVKERVGLRIRTLRKERRFSQDQLAEKIGRSVDAVSNLERGLSLPGFDTLERLSLALGVSLRDFFDGEDPHSNLNPNRVALQTRLNVLAQNLSDEALEVAVTQIEALGRVGPARRKARSK